MVNERIFVQKVDAEERLKGRILFLVLGFLWLVLIGFSVVFAWFAFFELPIPTVFLELVLLACIVLMIFPLRRLWHACFRHTHSPWGEPLEGAYSIEWHTDSDNSRVTQYFIGRREVQLPLGWEDHLREGEVLQGLGYEIDALNADMGAKVLILALSNGLSVEQEIGLGLLHIMALGYWPAALIAGLLWFFIAMLGSLARNPMLAWGAFWIPCIVACTLGALAMARTIRNRPICRRLEELRKRCIAGHSTADPTPSCRVTPPEV